MEPQNPLVLDSITRLDSQARGRVAYCASHGGAYCASLAANAGLAGVILSDAGVGVAKAGIAGLDLLEACGIPGATIGHRTARIGDGADGIERGRITYLNAAAAALGIEPGMACRYALSLLAKANGSSRTSLNPGSESRTRVEIEDASDIQVHALDSNSLVRAQDRGQIVITGSHGGLLAKDPGSVVKADVYAAVYNDADRGIDDAGTSRLPVLDARGIAGACVSAWTARIGDGMSSYCDGVISAVNETARRRGASLGMNTRQFVRAMIDAHLKEKS